MNIPPIIASNISCFTILLTMPKAPPIDKLPLSHIKIFTDFALHQRNPRHPPTRLVQNTDISELAGKKLNTSILHKNDYQLDMK